MAADQTTDSTPSVEEIATLISGMSAGETLTFAGDATWSSTVTVNKAITINGNGHTLTAGGSLTNGFFLVTGFTASDANITRITGFTFTTASDNSNPSSITVNSMTGTISDGNIRIDHNTFNFGSKVIQYAHPKGVIDNNTFYNGKLTIEYTAGSRAFQDATWEFMDAGTVEALFVEDNKFILNANYYVAGPTQEQIGTMAGGKLVIRYNEFDSDNLDHSLIFTPIMTHGSASGYWQASSDNRRGQSVVEIYENIFHGYRVDFPITVRGSANIIYNNDLTGTVLNAPRIYVREEEYEDYGGGQTNWEIPRASWPAEDQVHNTFVWNNTYNGSAYFNNVSHYALAITNNNCSASGTPYACCEGDGTGSCGDSITDSPFIQKDRDIFLHAPCGASDSADAYGNTCTHGIETFTNLNGAAGSNPTDGDPYQNYGTMQFTATGNNAYYGYTPYTYPHPLRGGRHTLGSGPQFSIGTGATVTIQ